ncbi:VOC family protein [Psychrobacillus sp. OK032]|uniref:VOC family protein n=1 Tax=Psychrobacillus sp. OK032 TaxID=1884358 RepID=UPI0008ABA6D5|nr:VOC family protein [Psychrobacillus sp. OK032]SES29564.1 Glyoxalase-like domain-containing protein [Psychrobacillus sp. OK032]
MYLDHIVHHVTKTPEEVAIDWNVNGVHSVIGGQHTHWGTYNALLYTKTSYIEWLALEHKEIAENANHPLINLMLLDLKTGPGFGTICIRTTTIDELCQQLERKGIETTGVLHAERKTTSGLIRKWKMLFVKEEIGDALPTPFFIEWEESDEDRYQLLQEDGTIDESNLQLNISACEFRVRNPKELMNKWKRYFDLVEEDEHILLLRNTKLVFKQLENGTKERLTAVHIEGFKDKETLIYEQAMYHCQ